MNLEEATQKIEEKTKMKNKYEMKNKYDEFDEIATYELSERCGAYHAAYVRCKKAEATLKVIPSLRALEEARNAFEDLENATQSLIAKHNLVLECIRSLFGEFGAFGDQKLGQRTNVYRCTFNDPYDTTEGAGEETVVDVNLAIEND